VKRTLYALVAAMVVCVIGFAAFLVLLKPEKVAPRAIKVAMTPERIERGRYLFESVADCSGCHSDRDWTRYGGPEKAGRRGVGMVFPPELGFPGNIVAPNITPDAESGLGKWTDGEKIRAIREGVSRDGRPLFAFMPYESFAAMSDDDAESLVAYLNTLMPVRNVLPATRLHFPVSFLNRLSPKPVHGPVGAPGRSDPKVYGAYLVRIAGCVECHSQLDKGKPVGGLEFAGGHLFQIGKLVVNSPNITPDDETGLGNWDEERFVTRFQSNQHLSVENAPPANQSNFTVMPWSTFSQMKDEDLHAVYAYLRTLKPIHNPVEVHPPQPAN
jgi:mono/diheme cytochrome c family protein